MAALIAAMSVSRFVYTPILPVMIGQHAVDHRLGALLASVNLLGYLAGAIAAGSPWIRARRLPVLCWSLLIVVLTLGAMVVPHATVFWLTARFLAGAASAFAFVAASSLVLDFRNASYATALFSSVGLGIALTGIMIPIVYAFFPFWNTGWIASTVLAAMLAIVTVVTAREPSSSQRAVTAGDGRSRLTASMLVAYMAYGVAGFAYVIPATFLVTIVAETGTLHGFAPLTWIVVGLVSAFTTFLWGPLSERIGKGPSLALSLVLLAVSCAAPAFGSGAFPPLCAAFCLGASFMAISMFTVRIVAELDPKQNVRRIGEATAVFSVGQVLGPVAAAFSYDRYGSYSAAFVVASLLVLLAAAAIAIAFGRNSSRGFNAVQEQNPVS